MTENSKSSGGRLAKLSGPLGFLLVVAVWTGINQYQLRSGISSGCSSEMTTAEGIFTDDFCDCMASEGAKRFPILATVPFVGRIFAPDEAEQERIGMEAGAACAVKSFES